MPGASSKSKPTTHRRLARKIFRAYLAVCLGSFALAAGLLFLIAPAGWAQLPLDALYRLLIAAAGVVLVIAGLAWMIAVGLGRSIQRLLSAVTAFTYGERGARAVTLGNDEISELAKLFNSLADRLNSIEAVDEDKTDGDGSTRHAAAVFSQGCPPTDSPITRGISTGRGTAEIPSGANRPPETTENRSMLAAEMQILNAGDEAEVVNILRRSLTELPYPAAILIRLEDPDEDRLLVEYYRPGRHETAIRGEPVSGAGVLHVETFFRSNPGTLQYLENLVSTTEAIPEPNPALGETSNQNGPPPELIRITQELDCPTAAVLPALHRDKLILSLIIGNLQKSPTDLYLKRDLNAIERLAQIAGVTIERMRLLESVQRQSQRERSINLIGERIRRMEDEQSILKVTADELRQASGAGRATIEVWNGREPTVYQSESPVPDGAALPGEIGPEAQPLTVPIRLRDLEIGSLTLEAPRCDPSRVWTTDDFAFVDAIAGQAALALENTRLELAARRLVDNERKAARISSRLWSTGDVEAIVRITLSELGTSLQAQDGSIEIWPAGVQRPEPPGVASGHPSGNGTPSGNNHDASD